MLCCWNTITPKSMDGGLMYHRVVFLPQKKHDMIREYRLLHVVTWRSRISGFFTYREMVKPLSQHMVQWKDSSAFNHSYPEMSHMIFVLIPLVRTCNRAPN